MMYRPQFLALLLWAALPGAARAQGELRLRAAHPGPPLYICGMDESGTRVHYSRGGHGFELAVEERERTVSRLGCPPGADLLRRATSGNGLLQVSATEDGGLRWTRPDDGREVLLFYPSGTEQQFVLTTPSGYFEGVGRGSDQLAGWALAAPAQGKTKPPEDFFALRLFPGYRAPYVIGRALLERDEEAALRAEQAKLGQRRAPPPVHELLPPVVSILEPIPEAAFSTSSVTVRFVIRSPSGQQAVATEKIDGRPPDRQIGTATATEQVQLRVFEHLPRHDLNIGISARTVQSVPVVTKVHLRWTGKKEAVEEKPDLHLLVVGVSKYPDEGMRLLYPTKDARDLLAVLKAQRGRRYREVHVDAPLLDEDATRTSIVRALASLARAKLRPQDVVILFLAGHGQGDPDKGTYHFVPYDAHLAAGAPRYIDATDLQGWLSQIPCKVVLFLDTCHAGSLMGRRNLLDQVSDDLAGEESGIYVFAASTGVQSAREAPAYENGAFSRALIEGLKGRADPGATGTVTVNQLDDYVSKRVRQLTANTQTPTTARPTAVPNFVLTQVPIPWYRQKRYVVPLAIGGALLVGGVVSVLATQIGPPPYDTGNSGWLVGGMR